MTAQVLERRTFSVSRASDFLEARALVRQTGQPSHRFGDVVIKELLDNALDACETVYRRNDGSRPLPLCPACAAALRGETSQQEVTPGAVRAVRRGAA